MDFKYIFYTTDESFDYGDFPNSTCYVEAPHGFSIEIDVNNKINLSSLVGFGNYLNEVKSIKTLKDFQKFLKSNLNQVQELDEDAKYTNLECFEELLEIVNENIRGTNENNKLQRRYDNKTALCN